MKAIKNMLKPANVLASFAVFLALGGAAFAAAQVQKNSVTSKAIKDAAVTGKDVKDDSLTGADVKESTLTLPADQTAPTGPAGGDLTGTYPTPSIGPNAVGTDEIARDGVGQDEIASNAVGNGEINDGSVGTTEIGTDAVTSTELGPQSVTSAKLAVGAVGGPQLGLGVVKSSQLGDMTTAIGAGVDVNAGTPQTTSVTCPPGRKVIGGGFAWSQDEANSIIYSAPSQTNPNTTWEVRGMVAAGSNGLFAWANCLAAS